MATARPLVAAVDDEKDILDTIRAVLKNDYSVVGFTDPNEALSSISKKAVQVVLLDIRMPDMDGIALLKKLKASDPDIEVIMLTALSDSRSATEALKAGAFDYVNKPFDAEELSIIIGKAFEKRALARDVSAYKAMSEPYAAEFIGGSPAMQELFNGISRIAAADSTVLITGETGTGKELVAKSVHNSGSRAKRPFIAVNCAAIPENLFESELFGHERGAFTGAVERRAGKFEHAEGGTIFLDEIGCLPAAMQAKLLRVLQEGQITRIGGHEPVPVDARVIAATNIDLARAVRKGDFREDLFYRLNVIPLKVPPLRERGEDIVLLSGYFLKKFSRKMMKNTLSLSDGATAVLKKYPWPGNVRELENMVERLVVLSKNQVIGPEDLPSELSDMSGQVRVPLTEACEKFEAEYITKAFRATGGNQTRTSDILNIDRTTLISKMKKHSIN